MPSGSHKASKNKRPRVRTTCDLSIRPSFIDTPAVLLGWATSPTFPIAIAQQQVSSGWGAYEAFWPTGNLNGVFIPAGKSPHVTGAGNLYSIGSEGHRA